MKILVTENHYNTILEFIKEEKGLKYFLFDFDDNILHMDTKIHMEKQTDGDWDPVDVSTIEFAKVRNDKNYRPLGNDFDKAFSDFGPLGDKQFIQSAINSIKQDKTAPSFDKFKEALIGGRLFAIVTARGHSPEAIREVVEYFINYVLTFEEKREMVKNLKKFATRFDEEIPTEDLLDAYLDKNEYIGVSNPGFREKHGIGHEETEKGKKIAIRGFVDKVMSYIAKIDKPFKSISVGFSDDDPKNVEHAEELLNNELVQKYPNVNFRVYDTSDPKISGGRKIIIDKE